MKYSLTSSGSCGSSSLGCNTWDAVFEANATRASTTASLLCVGVSMLCVCVCMSILGNGVAHSLCKQQNGQTDGRSPPYGPAATLTHGTRWAALSPQIPVDRVGSDIAHIPNLRDNTQAVTHKHVINTRETHVRRWAEGFVHRNGSFLRMSEKEAEGREQMSAEGNRWTENMRGKER